MSAVEINRKLAEKEGVPPTNLEYTAAVERALMSDQVEILTADAGTGKTTGCMTPLILKVNKTGQSGFYFTSNRNNRDQIEKDYRKSASEIDGAPPLTRYIGKRDYANLARCQELYIVLQDAGYPEAVLAQLQEIIQTLQKAETDPTISIEVDDLLPEDVFADGKNILSKYDISHHLDDRPSAAIACATANVREAFTGSSIIVMTIAQAIHSPRVRKAVRSQQVCAIVIDEVDQLVGLDFLSRESFTLSELKSISGVLARRTTANLKLLDKAIQELEDRVNEALSLRSMRTNFVMVTKKHVREKLYVSIAEALDQVISILDRVCDQHDLLTTDGDDDVRELAYDVDALLGAMEEIAQSFDPVGDRERRDSDLSYGIFARIGLDGPELHGFAGTPGRALRRMLYCEVPTILTTALLGMSPASFARQIGLPDSRWSGKVQSFRMEKLGSMRFVYFAGMWHPIEHEGDRFFTSPNYLDQLAQRAIVRYYRDLNRMLVVMPSYEDIAQLRARLMDLVKCPIYAQTRDVNAATLRAKLIDQPGILLLTQWEGYDITFQNPKEHDGRRGALDAVVVGRLPFAMPDPMLEALLDERFVGRGKQYMRDRSLSAVIRRTYQAVCRLVRGPADGGLILLPDSRMPPPRHLIDRYPLSLRVQPGYDRIIDALPERFRRDPRNFLLDEG